MFYAFIKLILKSPCESFVNASHNSKTGFNIYSEQKFKFILIYIPSTILFYFLSQFESRSM